MRRYGWIGIALAAVAVAGLVCRVEPIQTWFYSLAWWSYILVADAVLAALGGRSLVTARRRELGRMIPLSILVWLLFEAYNFRVRNWAYDGVPAQAWLRWPGYALAFATVLPAVLLTADLIARARFGAAAPAPSGVEPLRTPASGRPASWVGVAGVALSAAPLVWPRIFFPAVWIGPILLLDPLLERRGLGSLSLELAAGDRRRTSSLLLAGLTCGFLWELWNYWAGAKWVYTVPFFGGWRVFEMPLLGFLGFPPFALECWILYHLLESLLAAARPGLPRAAFWAAVAAVSVAILWGIDTWTVSRFAAAATSVSRS